MGAFVLFVRVTCPMALNRILIHYLVVSLHNQIFWLWMNLIPTPEGEGAASAGPETPLMSAKNVNHQ